MKSGDKVRLKTSDEYQGWIFQNYEMKIFMGKKVTVKKMINEETFSIIESERDYWWTTDMIKER